MNANEANQKQFIDGYLDNGVKLSFWWMDAGWYPFKDGWWNIGTWEPDNKRFPNGLRAVSDHAHKRGVNTLVWFEPERVTPGTLALPESPGVAAGQGRRQQKLLDLGNAEARQWLIEHVDKTMAEQGIDIYRQDFNLRAAGLLARQRHARPAGHHRDQARHAAIWPSGTSCAAATRACSSTPAPSGGRRNDLETLRRSVPLHKSDMEYPNLTLKADAALRPGVLGAVLRRARLPGRPRGRVRLPLRHRADDRPGLRHAAQGPRLRAAAQAGRPSGARWSELLRRLTTR